MSLFGKIFKSAGSILKSPIAAAALTAINPALGTTLGTLQGVRAAAKASALPTFPTTGGAPPMSLLPILTGAVGAGGRAVGRIARSRVGRIGAGVATGAVGAGVAEQFFGNGAPRRRRAKGISAVELRGYRKVATLVRACGMQPRAPARKKRKC